VELHFSIRDGGKEEQVSILFGGVEERKQAGGERFPDIKGKKGGKRGSGLKMTLQGRRASNTAGGGEKK